MIFTVEYKSNQGKRKRRKYLFMRLRVYVFYVFRILMKTSGITKLTASLCETFFPLEKYIKGNHDI